MGTDYYYTKDSTHIEDKKPEKNDKEILIAFIWKVQIIVKNQFKCLLLLALVSVIKPNNINLQKAQISQSFYT